MSNRTRNKVEIDTIAYYIATTGNDVTPGQTLTVEDSAAMGSFMRWSFEATAELARWQGEPEQPLTLLTVEQGGHVSALDVPEKCVDCQKPQAGDTTPEEYEAFMDFSREDEAPKCSRGFRRGIRETGETSVLPTL